MKENEICGQTDLFAKDITCPCCGIELEISYDDYGRMAKCPSCKETFLISRNGAPLKVRAISPEKTKMPKQEDNLGYWRSFLRSPVGIKIVLIFIALVCLREVVSFSTTSDFYCLARLCLNAGLVLGILKKKNWARYCISTLWGICILVLIVSAIGTDAFIGVILFCSFVAGIQVVPLFLPSANKWFQRTVGSPKKKSIWPTFFRRGLVGVMKHASMGVGEATLLLAMLTFRFIAFLITPFALLTIGRLIYCHFKSIPFSILWSIRGSVFISVCEVLFTTINVTLLRESYHQNKLRDIPTQMIGVCAGIFMIQFIWQGCVCFFSNQEFVLADKAWFGDLLAGLIVSIFVAIWSLLKYAFTRR